MMSIRSKIRKWIVGLLLPALLLLPQLLLATHSPLAFTDQGSHDHKPLAEWVLDVEHTHDFDEPETQASGLKKNLHGHTATDHSVESLQGVFYGEEPPFFPKGWVIEYHYSSTPTSHLPPRRPPRI